jgi:nucleoside-diphosphate-sugar epimerase
VTHKKDPPADVTAQKNVTVRRADLSDPATLPAVCEGVEAIVHFAGVLFAPGPEKFLPTTNVEYVKNLAAAAIPAKVKKFVIVSFPHVEGESTPENPARGLPLGSPDSVHALTRLRAEQHLFSASEGTGMTAIALRAGMIYSKGVLMIDAAQRLLERRLLGVWREPTWIHLISLPDFNECVRAALEKEGVSGVFNCGDDAPMTLQEFLDRAAERWKFPRPWRAPRWSFFFAGSCVELCARIFGTPAPLTRDFIRIGMASYCMDTTRMKAELLPRLAHPTLEAGIALL